MQLHVLHVINANDEAATVQGIYK